MEDNEFEEYINTSSDSMFHYTKMENGIWYTLIKNPEISN